MAVSDASFLMLIKQNTNFVNKFKSKKARDFGLSSVLTKLSYQNHVLKCPKSTAQGQNRANLSSHPKETEGRSLPHHKTDPLPRNIPLSFPGLGEV